MFDDLTYLIPMVVLWVLTAIIIWVFSHDDDFTKKNALYVAFIGFALSFIPVFNILVILIGSCIALWVWVDDSDWWNSPLRKRRSGTKVTRSTTAPDET